MLAKVFARLEISPESNLVQIPQEPLQQDETINRGLPCADTDTHKYDIHTLKTPQSLSGLGGSRKH